MPAGNGFTHVEAMTLTPAAVHRLDHYFTIISWVLQPYACVLQWFFVQLKWCPELMPILFSSSLKTANWCVPWILPNRCDVFNANGQGSIIIYTFYSCIFLIVLAIFPVNYTIRGDWADLPANDVSSNVFNLQRICQIWHTLLSHCMCVFV